MIQVKDPNTGKIIQIPAVKGKDGKSAYEYAKEAGYNGTEEEFIRLMAYDAESEVNKLYEKINNINLNEVVTDKTLTKSDIPADAKSTGDMFIQLQSMINNSNGTNNTIKGSDIPDYVVSEAERVAKTVQLRQGANTFSILACTDIHFSYELVNTLQQQASIKHMGQAMALVRKAVNIDLATMLGDIFWDGKESIDNALKGARYVNDCLYDAFSDIPCLRTRGNHECLYSNPTKLTDKQIFSNIGIFNKGAVYDPANRLGGYCYRDFEDLKIRVVCINTSESSTGAFNVSSAQNTWLKSALNLSSKGDGWRSILISHHPLDWNNSTSNVMNTIKAATGIICTIHGHVHGFLVDKLTNTSIIRMATPNACFGRENEYGKNAGGENSEGTEFGQTVTYVKTANTCNDTAFVVYTIDLDNMRVYADNYGSGYGRVISLDGTEIPTYTITSNLNNVTRLNTLITSLQEGASFGDVLTPIAGHDINYINITMGGVDITDSVYENGKISIPSITGNVTITGSTSEYIPTIEYNVRNLVRESEKQDSTNIYNGTGYKNGTYASETGDGTDTSCVSVGWIPYKWTKNNSIYVRGAQILTDNDHVRFYGYEDKTTISASGYIHGSRIPNYFNIEEIENGTYYKLTPLADNAEVNYIRISLVGTGENLIITVNEPIVVDKIAITSHPQDAIVDVGDTATFSIEATIETEDELSYIWQISNDKGLTWEEVPNSNSDTCSIKVSDESMHRIKVRCIVSGPSNSMASDVANLYISGLPLYTNLVPTSTTTDTVTVFNENGYMNGTYASGEHYGSDEQYVTSGFIEIEDDIDAIYVSGAEWKETNHCRIRIFHPLNLGTSKVAYFITGDAAEELSDIERYFTVTELGDKYYKLELTATSKEYIIGYYYCVSLFGTGENLIITHDEPIVSV